MTKLDNKEIRLEDVRISYAHIFTKRGFPGDPNAKADYSATFLLDKKKHAALIAECEEAIDDAKYDKWGDKQPTLRWDKICLRDGDDSDDPNYRGHMYVVSRSSRRPAVVDKNKTPLIEDDGRPYSGCYVNAVIRFWAMDNQFGKRVNSSLEAVQFHRDGQPFGAAPVDPDKAFEDYGGEDDRRDSRGGGRDRDRSYRDDRPSRGRDERPDRNRGDRDRDGDERPVRGRDGDRGRGDDRGSDREFRDERGEQPRRRVV